MHRHARAPDPPRLIKSSIAFNASYRAFAGDVVALRLCMDRIYPPRKNRPNPVVALWGAHPGDGTHYVNAKDKLSLSRLQARLIDLKLPIKIVEGE